MTQYWIENKDFKGKVKGKIGRGEVVEVMLMNDADKHWVNAKVQLDGKPEECSDTLKVLADYGMPTGEEFPIKVLEAQSADDDD
ncbi:conserved hypothetical protein [delta proteobacterium NaphS2]|nr:conserved hypothetical protein [delta proteobacterium NaphS2]